MKTGIVVIGRNEGERLAACLRSLVFDSRPVVYVDSGSTDGSREMAAELVADVVPLDLSIPFTAARARNVGWVKLNEKYPGLQYVQFVDGDCVVMQGWLDAAEAFLDAHGDVAVACGRRREIFPEASIYNRLCNIEWDTAVGEALGCGGDALMRIAALAEVKGYRDDLIAAEDSELCLRLREKGWKIWRMPNEMTGHDANIQRFSQWWTRTSRGGFAYAAVFSLHATSTSRIFLRELLRACFWALLLPLSILAALMVHKVAFGLLLLYPLQVARLALRRGAGKLSSWQFGVFTIITKYAETAGIVRYLVSKVSRRITPIIEYK